MGTNIDVSKIDFPEVMTVWEAAVMSQSSEMRIRTLIRKGTLAAEAGEKGGYKIKKSDLQALIANPPARGGGGGGVRADGKAFVIHVKTAQLTAVTDFLKSQGIELELRYKAKAAGTKTAKTPVSVSATPGVGNSKAPEAPVPLKENKGGIFNR